MIYFDTVKVTINDFNIINSLYYKDFSSAVELAPISDLLYSKMHMEGISVTHINLKSRVLLVKIRSLKK